MNRANYARVPKARTGADRRLDLVKFLAMARPEAVAAQTVESLAARYGVTVDTARQCLQNAGRLL